MYLKRNIKKKKTHKGSSCVTSQALLLLSLLLLLLLVLWCWCSYDSPNSGKKPPFGPLLCVLLLIWVLWDAGCGDDDGRCGRCGHC